MTQTTTAVRESYCIFEQESDDNQSSMYESSCVCVCVSSMLVLNVYVRECVCV